MAQAAVKPPAGFVLDGDTPNLPPGFVVDSAPVEKPAVAAPSDDWKIWASAPAASGAPDERSASQVAADGLKTVGRTLGFDTSKSLGDKLLPAIQHPYDTAVSAGRGLVATLRNAPSDLATAWNGISRNRDALNEAKGFTPPGSAAPALTGRENADTTAAATRLLPAAAMVGAAGDAAWEAGRPPIASRLQKYVTAPALNKAMDIRPSELQFGRNPGARVASDGITALTKDSLLSKMDQARQSMGTQLEGDLRNASGAGTVNGQAAIQQAMDTARRRPGFSSDKAFQSKLTDIQTQALDYAKNELGVTDPANMTPLQAQRLKSYLYDGIKFNGAAYEGDVNQGMVEAARNLNNSIQGLVPGSADTLARYGDYQVGMSGLKRSIAKDMAGQGTLLDPRSYAGPTTLAARLTRSQLPIQPEMTTGISFANPAMNRRLLGPGMPQIPQTGTEVPYAPGYRSNATELQPAPMAPATREFRTGRLLGPGTPLPPPTELPSGGFKMNVETGAPLKPLGPESGGGAFADALKRARGVKSSPIQGTEPGYITDPLTGGRIPLIRRTP